MRHGENIFMVGLMGAGKTTIGQMLARRLNYKFFDSDHVLEERTGASTATIFEVEGEPSFRAREETTIDELSLRTGTVLATGGGAIINALTRQRLSARGIVIYLHATAHTSYERVRRNRERPLLMVNDPLEKLSALYTQRHPLYLECATHIVESHRDRPNQVVQEVISLINDHAAHLPSNSC
jgi:shikimate kinase